MVEQTDLPPEFLDRLARHGSIVRAAREAAGIELDELARRAGIDGARIEDFEQGRQVPTELEAAELAVALGIPADLFTERGGDEIAPEVTNPTRGILPGDGA
jgi:transcriptional regulator with XRE-family HTH domain